MSNAASQKQMKALHSQLAKTLNAMLAGGVDEDGNPATDGDGKPLVTASVLNVARQFLSDNDIEADAGDPENRDEQLEALQQNADVLPFPEAGRTE